MYSPEEVSLCISATPLSARVLFPYKVFDIPADGTNVKLFPDLEHWNAPDEGIEAVSSNVSDLDEPIWASRTAFEGYSWNQGVEGLWRNIENQALS